MRKKLIAAIIAVVILIAAAAGVIVYLENKPAGQPGETTVPETTPVETETLSTEVPAESTEPTEETVGLTFPTEDPSDVTPEDSFGEEDVIPPVTGDSDSVGETEGPDANEAPEDEF